MNSFDLAKSKIIVAVSLTSFWAVLGCAEPPPSPAPTDDLAGSAPESSSMTPVESIDNDLTAAAVTHCSHPGTRTGCKRGQYCAPNLTCRPLLKYGQGCTTNAECGQGSCTFLFGAVHQCCKNSCGEPGNIANECYYKTGNCGFATGFSCENSDQCDTRCCSYNNNVCVPQPAAGDHCE
jgi:hypothetical protein